MTFECRHSKVYPNNFSFNAAMSSCEKGSQWQIALQLLNSTSAGSDLLIERIKGVEDVDFFQIHVGH